VLLGTWPATKRVCFESRAARASYLVTFSARSTAASSGSTEISEPTAFFIQSGGMMVPALHIRSICEPTALPVFRGLELDDVPKRVVRPMERAVYL